MALALIMASGVALAVNKIGTDGPDTLRGTNKADNLLGRGGNDRLFGGGGGRDNLLGGPGKDSLISGIDAFHPSRGDKILVGGPGNDWILPGLGSDVVMGGKGNDLLFHEERLPRTPPDSGDNYSGGPGKDVIIDKGQSTGKDLITCGNGFDWVLADRGDVVAPDCEEVHYRFDPYEFLFGGIIPGAQNFIEGLPPSFI
jgi:Ca2+-binding RTX toxin-like protein